MKIIIKVSRIAVKNVIKIFRRFGSFVEKFENIWLNLVTVVKKNHLRNDLVC